MKLHHYSIAMQSAGDNTWIPEMMRSIDRRVAIYITLYAVSPKLLLPYVSIRDKGNRVGFRVKD